MTRRLIALTTVLTLSLTLAACNGNDAGQDASKTSSPTTERTTVSANKETSEPTEVTEDAPETDAPTTEAPDAPETDAPTTETPDTPSTETPDTPDGDATVEVNDIHGTVTVPVNPEVVVALDNRTFETLADWDIKLAAAPWDVMPKESPYVGDPEVANIGNHREPDLEAIAAVNPDLVIVGQRFASYYETIKDLVPQAAVIDLNIDVSTEADTPGQNLMDGFRETTEMLGKIFSKEDDATALIKAFEDAAERVREAYDPEDTIMTVVVSGGNIGFSAPMSGRVWGPLYDLFGWTPALEVDGTSSDHKGDEISVEAIAQSDPDYLFVLDRDAATSSADSADFTPARDVISGSPALEQLRAVTEGRVYYAPADTYTNESIQTFTELFNELAEMLDG